MPTCGWCGAALGGASEAGPVNVQQADRRVFGIPPATGLLVVGTLVVALGVFLLFTGNVVFGVLAVLGGLALLAGFPAVARRPDESSVARRTVRSYDGLRERADATIESLAARASARRKVARIGEEIAELETARANGVRELGEASYARDETEVERLRSEIATADDALAAKAAEREQLLADTAERVEGARLRAQPTERLQREDEVRTEVTPPADDSNEGDSNDGDSERRAS